MLVSSKQKQRGDTIVEVMIVLAILGLAIGISYSTANRSLLNARQAQENAEASKLAQAQVEMLYAQSNVLTLPDPAHPELDHYIYDTTKLFCMGTNDGVVKHGFTGGTLDQTVLIDANYPSDGSCTSQNLYNISIRYQDTDPDDATAHDKFTIRVAWDDVLGDGQDTVTLVYRIHKPVDAP